MKNTQLLHPSFDALYQRPHTLLLRIIRTLFAIAGCLWIAKYVSFLLPEDRLQQFTSQQYQLYLVLLTLWGYDYRRSMQRMESVIAAASRRLLTPIDVSTEMLDEDSALHTFSIFSPLGTEKKWFSVVFTIALIVAASALLLRQILFLIS
ncbi:MAG: hypothetical protein JNL32_10985 [Candidatus Kapabacteria bacterium]|nr:hypothetical protein [Candidatus Kapabacteria bacterium]